MKLNTKKVCVVTGASNGIGYEVAVKLASIGHHVYALVRNPMKLQQKLDFIDVTNRSLIKAIRCDVSDPTSVQNAAELIGRNHRHIDLLVNNAGIAIPKLFMEMELSDWLKTINTNLNGVFYCCHFFKGLLSDANSADIVNISSRSGKNPAKELSAYCSSKFGLNGFTEVLQIELASHGIRVSNIAPGRCATNLGDERQQDWHINPKIIADSVISIINSDKSVFWGYLEIRPFK
jgi:NAD(P)-dependent dehydrogenase (short-subunit alcohol dehydrogenase family)